MSRTLNILVSSLISLGVAASAALAQSGPSTQAMTCGQAQSLVASRGAVVLHTGPTTYDRFVAGRGACMGNDTNEPVWVPTRDNPQCALFVCEPFRRFRP